MTRRIRFTLTGVAFLLFAIVLAGLAYQTTKMPSAYPPPEWLAGTYEPDRVALRVELTAIRAEIETLRRDLSDRLSHLKALDDMRDELATMNKELARIGKENQDG